ncbi:hypothetical protein HDU92_007148 [Lobulomyces angularis]|nr:hypothetical protein HDU92_007148 [Lobulomyces angularis]
MSEIEEFQEQLEELVKGIQNTFDKELPKLRGSERAEKCSYIRNRINRAKQVLRSIVVETRGLNDEEKVIEWKNRVEVYEGVLGKLIQDCEWAETSVDKEAIAAKKLNETNIDNLNAKQIAQQALQTQEKTQNTTANIKQRLEETIEIGAVTANELKRQGEQIKNVKTNVDIVDTNVKRANKQLRVFIR